MKKKRDQMMERVELDQGVNMLALIKIDVDEYNVVAVEGSREVFVMLNAALAAAMAVAAAWDWLRSYFACE
jgi:hypothetical protein